MGKETGLPKNIRQIGDIQGKEKIFLEDYVMTYIRKKEKQETNGYLGIFLGEKQEREGNTYVFIRGILDMPKESAAGPDKESREEQKESFLDKEWKEASKDKGWKEDSPDKGRKEDFSGKDQEKEKDSRQPGWMEKMEREYKEYFSEWSVQGCCVIGLYSPERMQMLSEMLPEAGGLIYHLQEQEETVYRVENGRYRQIKGYFVFYEQNRKMQEYMADVFDKDCVEKEGGSDNAIKSFRKKVKEKGIQKNTSLLKLASSFFVITVLVIGAVVVNKVDDIRLVREAAKIADATRENEITQIQTESSVLTVTDEIAGSVAVSGTVSDQSGSVSGMTDAQNAAVSGTVDDQSTDASGIGIDTSLWSEYSLSGSDSFWEEVPEDAAVNVSGEVQQAADDPEAAQASETAGDSSELQATDAAGNLSASQTADPASDLTASQMAGAASDVTASQTAGAASDLTASRTAGAVSDVTASQMTGTAETDPQVQEASSVRQIQAAYVIKEGDTLADICSRYYGNLDHLEEICEVNEITDANKIMPGQKIVLP